MKRLGLFALLLAIPLLLACAAAKKLPNNSVITLGPVETTQPDAPPTITGTVGDDVGDPVIGAIVELACANRPGFLGAATDLQGRFVLILPGPVGPCSLSVKAGGHYSSTLDYLTFPAGEHSTLSVILSPSGQPELVTVDWMLDYRTCSSGIRVTFNERTGQPSVSHSF